MLANLTKATQLSKIFSKQLRTYLKKYIILKLYLL